MSKPTPTRKVLAIIRRNVDLKKLFSSLNKSQLDELRKELMLKSNKLSTDELVKILFQKQELAKVVKKNKFMNAFVNIDKSAKLLTNKEFLKSTKKTEELDKLLQRLAHLVDQKSMYEHLSKRYKGFGFVKVVFLHSWPFLFIAIIGFLLMVAGIYMAKGACDTWNPFGCDVSVEIFLNGLIAFIVGVYLIYDSIKDDLQYKKQAQQELKTITKEIAKISEKIAKSGAFKRIVLKEVKFKQQS